MNRISKEANIQTNEQSSERASKQRNNIINTPLKHIYTATNIKGKRRETRRITN